MPPKTRTRSGNNDRREGALSAALRHGVKEAVKRPCDDDHANDDIDDDVDEDATLEELGRQALHARSRVRYESFLPSETDTTGLSTTTTARTGTAGKAAVGKPKGNGRNMTTGGADAPSLTTISPHARTQSLEPLTSNTCHMTPLPRYREILLSDSDDDSEKCTNAGLSSIVLTPAEKPSTALIRKVAATRPLVSPATLWICVNDDDSEEEEIKVISHQPSPALSAAHTEMSAVPLIRSGDMTSSQGLGSQQPRQEPISEVLPPTFRPRKGPLQANKPPLWTPGSFSGGCAIYDDDITDEERELEGDSSGCVTSGRGAPLPHQFLPTPLTGRPELNYTPSQVSSTTLPHITSRFSIIDDDNSDSGKSNDKSDIRRKNHNRVVSEVKREVNDNSDATQRKGRAKKRDPLRSLLSTSDLFPDEGTSFVSNNTAPGSPTGSVRDFLFSSRRRSSVGSCNWSFASLADVSAKTNNEKQGVNSKRAVEQLQPLFTRRFTRKSFFGALVNVVPRPHCLEPGEFWQAFTSVEYVGEGSFGIVWRCRTVDGDTVAVKSCPISLYSSASIEDAFSVLREVAIMRFLNAHEVPYVLPLHSAFFVQASETLPLDVVSVVKCGAHFDGKEKERQRLKEERRRYMRSKKEAEENQKDAAESKEKLLECLQHEKVRLPRFLSISVEDAMESDATVFLVTELCDGDLESMERHDGITKGVAFCVASALSAMHQLGLVHLDLKPSNILFAYENGPSQLCRLQRGQQQEQEQSSTSSFAVTGGNPANVPFLPSTSLTAATSAAGFSTAGSVRFYLSDFGNCRIVGPEAMDEVKDVFGTLEYMDSRALQYKTCSRATDCFSLGATLYELLYSQRLYSPCTNPKCVSEDDHTRQCYVEAAQRPVVLTSPPSRSSSTGILQKVMMGLLALDPKERWTAERCRSFFLIHDVAGSLTAASQ